jgi:hypothetical protein
VGQADRESLAFFWRGAEVWRVANILAMLGRPAALASREGIV